MTLKIRSIVIAWLVLLLATTSRAHEIGTTRVAASIEDSGAYRVEIVTDATALLDKLEAAGPVPAIENRNDAAAIERQLTRLTDVFERRVTLAFDGNRSASSIVFRVAPDATTATIVLSGSTAEHARTLTWSYGWTFASYAFSVRGEGGDVTEWLEGGQASQPHALAAHIAAPRATETALRYVTLGFTHILPKGLDHVLFVLGLFLLTRRPRPLLAQVSAFTIAHSITLGLSMYRIVSAPASIVEPLIAISIAYVAIENLLVTDLKRWRIALVFAFGLLHGLGFAGALGELGLPRAQFLTALVGFNAGVEAGQLTVIAAALAMVGWWRTDHASYRRIVVVPASLAIACVAVYWTIQRM